MPFESVISVSVAVPLTKLQLAPEAGAVNVTFSPLVRTPFEVTLTPSGAVNGLPEGALCGDPLVAAIPTTSAVGAATGIEGELLLLQPSEKATGRQISVRMIA